jgi:uncharacterized protein YraI
MKYGTMCVMAAAALLIGAHAAAAETLWVRSESVDVLSGKGAIYPAVATVRKGQELTVVIRDGKWVQVQAGNTTGWVYENSLSAQKVSGGGGMFTISPGTVAQVNTGAASRGFDESAEQYASNRRLSPAPLQHLVNVSRMIKPAEWEEFTRQGRIGPHAAR